MFSNPIAGRFRSAWLPLPSLVGLLGVSCVVLGTLPCAHAADQTTGLAAEVSADRLIEVVVTARRREENLQRVPVSVVAITATELQERSLDSLADVGMTTPNVTFNRTGNGAATGGLVYIRGVGQSDDLSSFDPAVGIYIDGVYFAGMQNDALDTMDVERVEILRGPQGTLFGRNTNGGAINIVTRQPSAAADALDAQVQVTGGNFNRFDLLASANIPLVTDRAALQLGVARRSENGYAVDGNGVTMGNVDRELARAALLLKPVDGLSIVWRVDGTTYDEANAPQKLFAVNDTGGLLSLFNAYQGAHGLPLYNNQWVTNNYYTWDGTGPNFSKGNLGGTSLTVDWDNAWGAFKSISAYRVQRMTWALDIDGSPITEADYWKVVQHYQVSQEFQQSGKSFSDRLTWVAGLYLFGEHAVDDEMAATTALNTAFSAIFGGPFSANFCQCLYISNKSYAGYAQGTYNLTNQLHLTLGVRFTDDNKRVDRLRTTFENLTPRQPLIGIGAPVQPSASLSDTFHQASPRFGLDYQWTPDVMTYVSVAQGFKSGGFNGRSDSVLDFNEFSPEKVWTYEIGLRSDWFDRRLRANVTGFYNDYKDLQVATSYSKIVNGAPVPLSIIENIPKARTTGAEVEINAIPVRGLQLIGGLGLTYAKYVTLNPTSKVSTSTNFVNTPQTTYYLAAVYTLPLTERNSLTGRVDYMHKSAIDYDLLNSPFLEQQAYGLLNARLTLSPQSGKGLSYALFGTNLNNVKYFTGGASNYDSALGWAWVDTAPPRQWGFSATYRF